MTEQVERLAVVESEVKNLKDEFHEFKRETRESLSSVNNKLDDLLQLKHKTFGAFWLAASIIGLVLNGLGLAVFNLFRG